ncbi:MAG TPA: group 1 truncated hemoglobin [Pseudohongiella sp.]|nr:group 1 truncated hemoglobin [Pseudohongiella sp.]HEA61732.1 group 1 truncated hemoglobin [Pseudohongiella sp.]
MTIMLLCAALTLSACAIQQPSGADDNLYQALGAEPGIEQIADNFIMEIAYDPRVFDRFADSNVERFREKIIEHFCFIADGPCEYTGDSMVLVHRGMDINSAEFNAVVEDLIDAMDKAGTPISAQNRLLERLAGLRPQIIEI